MNKQLHELIGYIPVEIKDKLPPGISDEQYWTDNNSFLNAYDKGSIIVLTYRCKFTNIKAMVNISNFKWYGYVHKNEWINNIPLGY